MFRDPLFDAGASSDNDDDDNEAQGECPAAALEIFPGNDPLEKYKINQAYCFHDDVFAEGYVDIICDLAEKELRSRRKPSRVTYDFDYTTESGSDGFTEMCHDASSDSKPPRRHLSRGSACTFSGWPKISEFNIKLGVERLEEYVESWSRNGDWMCYVEFLGFESEQNSNYFVYEVEFSKPTKTYPIPQATASIYFSMEVSKMVPPEYDRPIHVSYVYESHNLIHYPTTITVYESWVRKILRCKENFFRTMTF